MANHLREFLDTSDFRFAAQYVDKQDCVGRAVDSVHRASENAICFFLGAAKEIAELDCQSTEKIYIDLPFDQTWFEFTTNDGAAVVGVMAEKATAGKAWLTAFTKQKNCWTYRFAALTQDNLRAMTFDVDAVGDAVIEKLVIGVISTALAAMACVNVKKIEFKPSEKLQKRREKRGKKPLFSYWTLEIDLSREKKLGDFGGEHSSPRLHLRRGHPRQFAPGKWTWVQPCVVGNKALGMVHKDYVLNA